MKRVLITGGAGFIAHHAIKHILENTDWEIVSLDRLDYSGNLNRIADMMNEFDKKNQNRVRIVFHDLRAEVNEMLQADLGNFNYIIHMAASSHVDRSIDDPMCFVLDNVVATCNILNFCRKNNSLERFIYFSTDEVFGPAPKGVNYKERDRYNSTNPYSATKAGGEELAVAFENSYNLPIYITHTMNVFGERQHPEKFIPMVIRKVRDDESVTIHSDETKKIPGSRHYIHAKDVADGCLYLLNNGDKIKKLKKDYGGAKCPKFNLVGPVELNNLELAKKIAEAQSKNLKYEMVDFHSSRPGHDLRYALDGQLMQQLGWSPKISIDERINQVVEWSLKNNRWLKT
jgi:dTDP-glucose 4,6-dehydratase|tara:strand:- start:245 stop:1276 length:1032 start_codon:yes stop_codon:yes gene_type:complete